MPNSADNSFFVTGLGRRGTWLRTRWWNSSRKDKKSNSRWQSRLEIPRQQHQNVSRTDSDSLSMSKLLLRSIHRWTRFLFCFYGPTTILGSIYFCNKPPTFPYRTVNQKRFCWFFTKIAYRGPKFVFKNDQPDGIRKIIFILNWHKSVHVFGSCQYDNHYRSNSLFTVRLNTFQRLFRIYH